MSEEDDVKVYFGNTDIISCADCREAKILGNKYYNRLSNILDRIAEHCCQPFTEYFNVDNFQRKLDGLNVKFDKTQVEFIGILNGRCKCCCPQDMLDDYLKAWKKL